MDFTINAAGNRQRYVAGSAPKSMVLAAGTNLTDSDVASSMSRYLHFHCLRTWRMHRICTSSVRQLLNSGVANRNPRRATPGSVIRRSPPQRHSLAEIPRDHAHRKPVSDPPTCSPRTCSSHNAHCGENRTPSFADDSATAESCKSSA